MAAELHRAVEGTRSLPPKAARKTSIAPLSALDATPHQLIDIAAACGFDFVGLRLLPVTKGEAASPLIGDRLLRRDLVKHAADCGVGILDIELFKLSPAIDVATLEPALGAAAELGARHALTQVHDLDAARAIDRFGALCDLAAAYNLTCDVEFLSWTEMRGVSDVCQLLRAANRANGGICLDTLHFWRSGCEASDIESLPQSWIRFAQISDARGPREALVEEMIRVAREDRLAPGEGEIDLYGIVARLPPDAVLSLEVPNLRLARTLSNEQRLGAARSNLLEIVSAVGAGAAQAMSKSAIT